MGTELIARGLVLAEASTEEWNLTHPEVVRTVHAEYIAAGAEVVLTNTFGLARERTIDKAAIATAAVEHARSAGKTHQVWGTLGPCMAADPGRALGDAAALLARAGVDAICLETVFDPAELEAGLAAVRALGLPVIASITVSPGNSGLESPTGVPMDQLLRVLRKHRPDVAGLNCSLDAERMQPALARLLEALDHAVPCLAKPQAKQSQKCLVPRSIETPELFARRALGLVRDGATAIGACCGAGPTAISALRSAIDAQWPERAAS